MADQGTPIDVEVLSNEELTSIIESQWHVKVMNAVTIVLILVVLWLCYKRSSFLQRFVRNVRSGLSSMKSTMMTYNHHGQIVPAKVDADVYRDRYPQESSY
jgi:hypothetical protein